MPFRTVLSEDARHQLRGLETSIARRIVMKLEEARENPAHFFERLTGREEYKLRVGDWRIIANILPKEETLVVRAIGHRKNIYDKL